MNRCWDCYYCARKRVKTMEADCTVRRIRVLSETPSCEHFLNADLIPRKARYRVKFRDDQVRRYTEKLHLLAYARGYSEGLEKGMQLYHEAADKIRRIISEGRNGNN